jgi:hypothetical protein
MTTFGVVMTIIRTMRFQVAHTFMVSVIVVVIMPVIMAVTML